MSARTYKTPRCPTMQLACSTAYRTRGCRCDDCRAWYKARKKRDGQTATKRERKVRDRLAAEGKLTPVQLSRDRLKALRENEDEIQAVADMIAEGKSRNEVAEHFGIKLGALHGLMRERDDIFNDAIRASSHALADRGLEVIQEARTDKDISTAQSNLVKAESGYMQWLAGKRWPEVYGDRLAVDGSLAVTFGGLFHSVLQEQMAKLKAAPVDTGPIVDAEVELIEGPDK